MGGKQLGFGDYEQATAKKRTKRERFLSEMEKVVPWKALLDLIGITPIQWTGVRAARMRVYGC